MTFTLDTSFLIPVLAIAAGIAILAAPKLLNYIVALYLIASGVVGLINVL
jgi:hypothetical protein